MTNSLVRISGVPISMTDFKAVSAEEGTVVIVQSYQCPLRNFASDVTTLANAQSVHVIVTSPKLSAQTGAARPIAKVDALIFPTMFLAQGPPDAKFSWSVTFHKVHC